jgi:hypothetical protein
MKKPYTRPGLVVHGTVGTLTNGLGGTPADGQLGSTIIPV